MPNLAERITHLDDFVRSNEERFFLIGGDNTIWLYNRVTGTFDVQGTGFSVTEYNRWQAADMNNSRLFVNGADPLQEYNGSALAAVVETPVADVFSMPQNARFILNSVNHLVLADVEEGGTRYRNRIRWSELDDFHTWTPDILVNEAGYFDIGEGGDPILGIHLSGLQRIFVIKRKACYTITYYGRPTIYANPVRISDVGAVAPYASVSVQDKVFFAGERDFYAFNGSAVLAIGTQRIKDYFFGQLDLAGVEGKIFAFSHPSFPEIWWVYQPKTDTRFMKCVVFNWELNIWFTRNYFPMSALGLYLDQTVRSIDDMTWTFDDPRANVTWNEKLTGGLTKILGGDENGEIYEHGVVPDGDGVPLNGVLETGLLDLGSRNRQKRVHRLSFDNEGTFYVRLGCKNRPGDEITYEPSQVIQEDGLYDSVAVAREFQIKLEATDIVNLGEFTVLWMPAGDRPSV